MKFGAVGPEASSDMVWYSKLCLLLVSGFINP